MTELDLLREIFPFWARLSSAEQHELADNTSLKKFKKGDVIHGGADDCTGVIGMINGRLRSYLLSEEGKEVTLFRLLRYDCCILSASCMLRSISFDLHVSAEEDTELLLINPAVFDSLSKRNIALSEFSQELLSTRFSEAMWVMEQILFMKFDRRLAIFLMEQGAIEGGDTIHLTHQEIAAHMGSAREVVSRMLKYFEGEGYIKLSRKGITILAPGKLRKME